MNVRLFDESQKLEGDSMAREIRVGDEVRLKAGGPIMTVERIWPERGQTMVRCDWIERGTRHSGSVAITSLTHAEE